MMLTIFPCNIMVELVVFLRDWVNGYGLRLFLTTSRFNAFNCIIFTQLHGVTTLPRYDREGAVVLGHY